MANITHKVVWGDTLSELAVKYNTTVSELVRLNNIKDPDYIVVGQVLIISGTAASQKPNTSSKATIDVFGLQTKTDRTVYATWKWDKSNTDKYKVLWKYYTGDGVGFIGSDSEVTYKQSLYTAPENATWVSFQVKPISKTKKSSSTGKETYYWTANWSTTKKYSFDDNPPVAPPAPNVEIKDFTLTAKLENLDIEADSIVFQVVKDNTAIYRNSTALKVMTVGGVGTGYVEFQCVVESGHQYKVRCRARKDDAVSEWSPYSSNVETTPAASEGIKEVKALTETSVSLTWEPVSNCTGYEIQYATSKTLFDSSNAVQSLTLESVATHAEITGLESGQEYFFRLRATNTLGKSAWTDLKSIILGEPPEAPTTWSSTTTAVIGEPLNLYWVHNGVDGSSQTFAELELTIDGLTETHTIQNSTNDDEKDKTSVYEFATSGYTEGATLQWRVRTAGITNTYGDWSIQRTVDIYAPPSLALTVTGSTQDESLGTLSALPIKIYATAGPKTQTPIAYYLSVIAKEAYETYDNLGNVKMVNQGEEVYAKQFDIMSVLDVELGASDLTLENNVSYTIKCSVTMNSGLTAEESVDFTVAWEDAEYEPNAVIDIDPDTYAAYIRPYCEDNLGRTIEGVLISLYRREFDGSFTEIAKDIPNSKNTFVTDPHPALDYARYRVVAKTEATGAIMYCDLPGVEVGESSAIIQWDEAWSEFDVTDDAVSEQPPWSGSLVKLPYNLDVSDSHSPDVELVEYIGRSHPIAYYGTQLGETSSWSVDIEKDDKDTLYALRRLARWMGNVYVREPSGSGYWAHVVVRIPQTHAELIIPVSIDISRVEGGM